MPQNPRKPDARINYTLEGADGLLKGRAWKLETLFGSLGAPFLESVFRNKGAYLPENFRAFLGGWAGEGPLFRKTIALPAPLSGGIEVVLDFAKKELSMAASARTGPAPDLKSLKKFAQAEISRLRAMSTAHSLSARAFEGSARWRRAVAYIDSNGDWVEEYEMEAAENWNNP